MKLKLGSRWSLEDPVEMESNCSVVNASSEAVILEPIHASVKDKAMTIDTNCFSSSGYGFGQWRWFGQR